MPNGNRRRQPHPLLIALAKAINRRRDEIAELPSGRAYKISTAASRILENDPDYSPYRERSANKQRQPATNPGLLTVKKIATDLDTTVGHLLGEPGFELTVDDRRRLRDVVQFMVSVFRLNDLDARDHATNMGEFKFVVDENQFIERDHDYPRDLHAWIVPEHAAAAGPSGFEGAFTISTTQILHSIREIKTGRLQVVRVVGESMADRLKNGWKVLVDTTRNQPREGDLVAVYVQHEGSILGYWHRDGDQVRIGKANPEYDAVSLSGEWVIWGTVTTIVEAPA